MNRATALLIAFLVLGLPLWGQEVDHARVGTIIQAFASGAPERIAALVAYPLRRRYPLPPVRDAIEFVARYAELIDEDLLAAVAQGPVAGLWAHIGWRGLAFNHGELWLNEAYQIRAINYETSQGAARWKEIVEAERRLLPPVWRDFDRPVYQWTSSRFQYRLDAVGPAYRLLVWDLASPAVGLSPAPVTDPVRVYEGGELASEGNMGYFRIDWTRGATTVRVQNHDDQGKWRYHFLIYDTQALGDDERALARYIDAEGP